MDEIKKFRKSLLEKVVRMEAMEAKFGIEINNLSIISKPDSEYMTINFEILATNTSSLPDYLRINVAVYDNDNTITLKSKHHIDIESFNGFSIESYSYCINTLAKDVSKIIFYLSV